MPPFARLADESFAYLTTVGRVSGKPHTIEIWFAIDGTTMYMLSGSRTVSAKARIVRAGTAADVRARELLDGKYMGWSEGKRLSSWARNALPVAIDLPE